MSDANSIIRLMNSILRSDAINHVQFRIASVSVMPYGYGYIADMLQSGTITVVFNDLGNLVTAAYNKCVITINSNGAVDLSGPGGRGTLVHESTHAVMDAIGVGKMIDYGDCEVAAYVAQYVYSMASGDVVNVDGPWGAPSARIANSVLNSQGLYDLPPAEYQDLKSTLLSGYGDVAQSQGQLVPGFNLMHGIPARVYEPMQP